MASRRVTDPVLRVQHDKHTTQALFVVGTAKDWFLRPDTSEKVFGPKLVLVQEIGTELKVFVYGYGDKRLWNWLATLAKAGAWALNSKAVAPLLPDDLIAASPRFDGTSPEQRKAGAERLPKPAPTGGGKPSSTRGRKAKD